MSPTTDTSEPNFEAIEGEIAETRASLDRKIEELERRLDPRQVGVRLRHALSPEPYLGWIAASAVAVGSVLAARGLRRPPKQRAAIPDEAWDYVDCVIS